MLDFAGGTAFVTGGAQGIGLGIARALAREGMRLALADIDEAALATAAAELASTTKVETFVLDVTDRDAFARAADAAEDRLGPVTLLCNNAGVGGNYPVPAMSYPLWDLFFGVNLGGVIHGIQTFLPRMVERGTPAHIANTAAQAGLAPMGGETGYMYEGAKAGVIGLSEGLAKQLEHEGLPIGLSVLSPGPVATDMVAHSQAASGALSTGPLSDAQAEERAGKQTQQESFLRLAGLSPDAVGTMLVEGVRAGKLHIITDRTIAPQLAARSRALFSALPAETEHDRTVGQYTAMQMRKFAASRRPPTR
ncbi:SDR family NAD(P)-dependent oxidoreductase [Streptomyces radicis]|uniref:SDR family NAD(P)-dependent oxidoreductase n=1 Tax=Streptomyces radicis TaxID=1750517 RepID=A0A3A9W587_9ACTN|nr:SDR family NAD(P)-dependent oxidoreductase [Streptomyces radicis]RKN08361.1 SDR family NAD(P)-dependent oxidoreductase [Streptomyces radicis]RKN21603.1 SDR family NAD(P)-dependent oxidoreductase [Streptomyces radicis]